MKSPSLIIAFFICVVLTNSGYAQLCSGALGDPIVNIDFGSGTSKGDPLGTAITAYTYKSTGQLGEGEYTIANTTAGLKGTAWTTIPDHTGNTNGYMMVINSATLASEGVFYKKTVTGLCPNTTYEFSAWMINVMSFVSTNPNVTFKIKKTDGTLIKQFDSGQLQVTGKWVQSGFFFTTGTESDVEISVLNNAPSAQPGNDLALDDITFRACGPIITSGFNGGNQTTTNICVGTSAQISLNASVTAGYSTPQYQWQVNKNNNGWTDITGAISTSANVAFTNAVEGSYQYRLAVGEAINFGAVNCRVLSPVLTVTVNPLPHATAGASTPLCAGETLTLTASGGASYKWTGPGNFTSILKNPVIANTTDVNGGTYTVHVTNTAGCTDIAQTQVVIGTRPTVTISPAVTICEGESATLVASGGVGYSWSPAAGLSNAGSSSIVVTPTKTTTYKISVTDNVSVCAATDSVTVTVLSKPIANAGTDKSAEAGDAVILDGTVAGAGYTYSWSPTDYLDDPTKVKPTAKPPQSIKYTLTAISNNGCGISTDEVAVTIFQKIAIPNTFTPNHDGVNDLWKIDGLSSYPGFNINVFSRNGTLVYQSQDYLSSWDGTYRSSPLPVGTYYYIVDPRNGFSKMSGWVLIIR
jgi:gliding motility-associated-like protein